MISRDKAPYFPASGRSSELGVCRAASADVLMWNLQATCAEPEDASTVIDRVCSEMVLG